MVGADKRTATRYERRIDIEYRVGDDWKPSKTRNLSLGGALIACDEKLPSGVRVQIRFRIPTQKEPIEVGGQVRWVDSQGFGVQFDGLRARDVWALGKFFELP